MMGWDESIHDGGYRDEEIRQVLSKLYLLHFDLDRVGDKIVSRINGEIVFVDRHWEGDRPKVGETWICSVSHPGTVYVAEPLMNVNQSFMLGLGESWRNEIIDALWENNRGLFEDVFEQKYRQSALVSACEQLKSEHLEEVEGLKAQIESLKIQLNQNRMMLNSRSIQDGRPSGEGKESCTDASECPSTRTPRSSILGWAHVPGHHMMYAMWVAICSVAIHSSMGDISYMSVLAGSTWWSDPIPMVL